MKNTNNFSSSDFLNALSKCDGKQSTQSLASESRRCKTAYKQRMTDNETYHSNKSNHTRKNHMMDSNRKQDQQIYNHYSEKVETKLNNDMDDDHWETQIDTFLEQYLGDLRSLEDTKPKIEQLTRTRIAEVIEKSIQKSLKKKFGAQRKVGELISALMDDNIVSSNIIFDHLSIIYEVADQIAIVVPKIWELLPHIIFPILATEKINFRHFKNACAAVLNTDSAVKLLLPTLAVLAKEKGLRFARTVWDSSNVNLQDFLPPYIDVDAFIKENGLEYLISAISEPPVPSHEVRGSIKQSKAESKSSSTDTVCTASRGDHQPKIQRKLQEIWQLQKNAAKQASPNVGVKIQSSNGHSNIASTRSNSGRVSNTPQLASDCQMKKKSSFHPSTNQITMDIVQEELRKLMKEKKPYGIILDFILNNVGGNVDDMDFVSALITAMCEAHISEPNHTFDQFNFKRYEKLVKRFLKSEERRELECLNTIHYLVVRLLYPKGLIKSIFKYFLDSNLISIQTALKWRDNKETLEHKGLSLMALQSFYATLLEKSQQGHVEKSKLDHLEKSQLDLMQESQLDHLEKSKPDNLDKYQIDQLEKPQLDRLEKSQQENSPVGATTQASDFQTKEMSSFHASTNQIPMDIVQEELRKLMKEKKPYGKILDFIVSNVGGNTDDMDFIHALITAMCEAHISEPNHSFDQFNFKRYEKLVKRFLKNEERRELECLNTIHYLFARLQYPKGLIKSIFKYFLESNLITSHTALKWRDSKEALEHKGLSLMALQSFYAILEKSQLSHVEKSQLDDHLEKSQSNLVEKSQLDNLENSQLHHEEVFKIDVVDKSELNLLEKSQLDHLEKSQLDLLEKFQQENSPVGTTTQEIVENTVEEKQPTIETKYTKSDMPPQDSAEPPDSYNAFGQFCAAEMRQLKMPENKLKLKRLILEAICNVSEAEAMGKIYSSLN